MATKKKTTKRAPYAKVGREYAAAPDEKRTARMQMRLRQDEKELFERASAEAGDLDASSWARRILLAAARKELGLR